MVLDESQQHGHHHLLLGLKLFPCVSLVGSSQHEEVVDDGLQGRDGCGDTRVSSEAEGDRTQLLRP